MASTYLITGGAGFIGRQLSTELLSYGHSVRVIDSLIPQVHGDTDPPLAGVDFYEGDIRDANLVDRALAGTDGVFHLAAEVGVGQSMYEIARYVGGNDLGTAVLLERLANNPVCAAGRRVFDERVRRRALPGRRRPTPQCRPSPRQYRSTALGSGRTGRNSPHSGSDG